MVCCHFPYFSMCHFLYSQKVGNLISKIILQCVKSFWLFFAFSRHSHTDTRLLKHTNTHIFFTPLISRLSWSGLFWIYPTALFISLWLWIGMLRDGPLSEQNYFPNSNRELSIGGLYFTIASIDVQHYNSWVAPHFTQPNGLTPRAHWGSRQGSFPSFLWSKFYEIQGLGLIESHSQLLHSTAVCLRFDFKLSSLMT